MNLAAELARVCAERSQTTGDDVMFDKESIVMTIIEKLPVTVDGVKYFIGDKLWMFNPDCGLWNTDAILSATVVALSSENAMFEYPGKYVVQTEEGYECGSDELYAKRETIEDELELMRGTA